ncbi:IMP cyclohydrolase [Methanocaldococcus infernus]
MYIGRFLVVGKTPSGESFVAYRVSSRSFPNRVAKIVDNKVYILPKDPEEVLKNPYISYCCLRVEDKTVVAGNGSHVDFIAEKLIYGKRDALAYPLLALDYEKDEYRTPRIATVVDKEECYLGYIKDDELAIKKVSLNNGEGIYLGVYNSCKIDESQKIDIPYNKAEEIAKYILNYKFSHPVVCVVAVIYDEYIDIKIAP